MDNDTSEIVIQWGFAVFCSVVLGALLKSILISLFFIVELTIIAGLLIYSIYRRNNAKHTD